VTELHLPATAGSSERTLDAVDYCIRSALFVGVFLIIWISFHPFVNLAEPPAEVTEGGNRINQIGYSLLFLVLATWTYLNGLSRLRLLMRPTLVAMILWFVASAALSWDPALAGRRLIFSLMLMAIGAMVLLLPRNQRHFADLIAAAVVIVLLVSYLGVALTPSLAVHQATDFLEPEHAGNWRGVFPHKNQAGAAMAVFSFVGLFIARTRNLALGLLIVALSVTFLAFSHSKTAIGLFPVALLMAEIVARVPRLLAVATALALVVVLNVLTVGSVYSEAVRSLLDATISDSSFTGRTDIWQFAIAHLAERPVFGFGFSSFWGTEYVVYGLSQSLTWANAATDAHNAYLNLALTVGIPGLVLAIAWIVVLPVADFCRAREAGRTPLQMLFLRVWLFGLLASCFESVLFQQIGEVWFLMLTAAFGLRFLTLAHARP
jgi:O-antigen ligase